MIPNDRDETTTHDEGVGTFLLSQLFLSLGQTYLVLVCWFL